MSSGHGGRRANAAHVVHGELVNWLTAISTVAAAALHFIPWSIYTLARHRVVCTTVVCGWAILVAVSMGWLARFSVTPGAVFAPPPLAAANTPLKVDGKKHLLVVAIHPRCPCSRASVGELTRLLTWHHKQLSCAIFAYQPLRASPDWLETDLVDLARALPSTFVIADIDGRYAEQLGLSTSGAVVLYSPFGDIAFHGGITPARGHWGDNLGSDAIGMILAGTEPLRRVAPVYGCPIR